MRLGPCFGMLFLLLSVVACRMVGAEAEAAYGITAEEVYSKMIKAIDPQGDMLNAKSCLMVRDIRETKMNILGTVSDQTSVETTVLRPPQCLSVTTAYAPGVFSWIIVNEYGAWSRDLAGVVTQLRGKPLEAARFYVKKAMLSGVNQRQLWEDVILEESDILPEKWYRLVLVPKISGMNPTINYVNRKTFMLERVAVIVPTDTGNKSVICDIDAYQVYNDDILVPSLIKYYNDQGIVSSEVFLKTFKINDLEEGCNCPFDPYRGEEDGSAYCKLHSPSKKALKTNLE